MAPKGIGWLSSGRDKEAINLLETAFQWMQKGLIPLNISFVFCNREKGEDLNSDTFLSKVEELKIPLIALSSERFLPEFRKDGSKSLARWRELFDEKVISLISLYEVQFLVLAGYMLILSPIFCRYHKIINLHPSLPGGPEGRWQEVIWRLMETEADKSGVMIHLVTPQLDQGPPISYCSFSLRGEDFDSLWDHFRRSISATGLKEIKRTEGERNPLFMAIRKEGVKREIPLLLLTIRKIALGEIRLDKQDKEIKVLSLDEEVKNFIA